MARIMDNLDDMTYNELYESFKGPNRTSLTLAPRMVVITHGTNAEDYYKPKVVKPVCKIPSPRKKTKVVRRKRVKKVLDTKPESKKKVVKNELSYFDMYMKKMCKLHPEKFKMDAEHLKLQAKDKLQSQRCEGELKLKDKHTRISPKIDPQSKKSKHDISNWEIKDYRKSAMKVCVNNKLYHQFETKNLFQKQTVKLSNYNVPEVETTTALIREEIEPEVSPPLLNRDLSRCLTVTSIKPISRENAKAPKKRTDSKVLTRKQKHLQTNSKVAENAIKSVRPCSVTRSIANPYNSKKINEIIEFDTLVERINMASRRVVAPSEKTALVKIKQNSAKIGVTKRPPTVVPIRATRDIPKGRIISSTTNNCHQLGNSKSLHSLFKSTFLKKINIPPTPNDDNVVPILRPQKQSDSAVQPTNQQVTTTSSYVPKSEGSKLKSTPIDRVKNTSAIRRCISIPNDSDNLNKKAVTGNMNKNCSKTKNTMFKGITAGRGCCNEQFPCNKFTTPEYFLDYDGKLCSSTPKYIPRGEGLVLSSSHLRKYKKVNEINIRTLLKSTPPPWLKS